MRLDFAGGADAAVEVQTLHAPALESREAQITQSAQPDRLKDGKFTVLVPHASGVRLTVA